MKRSKIIDSHSFRPIFNNKCKEMEVYLYIEEAIGLLIIGYRGGSEYRMELNEARKLMLRHRMDISGIDFKKLIKLVREELECVEFEEIIETKLLQ